jgi:hypothetical protein
VGDAVHGAVRGAVNVAVHDAVHGAVRLAVNDAVGDAVHDAVHGAVNDAVGLAVRLPVGDAVNGAVDVAVNDAVHGAVGDAVNGAVGDAVRGAVRGAVNVAVNGAVGLAVDVAVDVAVDGAVNGAVNGAVDVAVGGASEIVRAVVSTIQSGWSNRMGGQFWVGGWYWGAPSFVSFFQEVCGLDLGADMNARAAAYSGTCESACWWWPHRDFVMVCERPTHIDRDERGRLHSLTRQAIEWPDGWGLYRIHGVEVPSDVVLHPERITAARIRDEQNAEVRRVMLARFEDIHGRGSYIEQVGAKLVHKDEYGELYRVEMGGDEALQMVRVLNSTPESDGTIKVYWLRVNPNVRRAHDAIASTFRNPKTGERLAARDYTPMVQT